MPKWFDNLTANSRCLGALAGALRRSWSSLRGWFANYHVTALTILATAFVLLFLAIINRDLEPEPRWAIRYMHEHGSDILMALIVAFLALVIGMADFVNRNLRQHTTALDKHAKKIDQSAETLHRFETSLTGTAERLEGSRINIEKMSDFLRERCEMWEQASESVNPDAAPVIHGQLQKLAKGWGNLICLPTGKGAQTQEGARLKMESRCWESAFLAYAEEELKDLTEARKGGGPILVTNYPTYLRFLESISKTFVSEAKRSQFTQCFLALANTVPIQWSMLCQYDGTTYWCSGDRDLAAWRNCCGALARLDGVVFRRIYLSSKDDNCMRKYRVPHDDQIENQLQLYAWTDSDPKYIDVGLHDEEWTEIRPKLGLQSRPAYIKPQEKHPSLYISASHSSNQTVVEAKDHRIYQLEKFGLRQLSVEDINAPPYDRTALKRSIDDTLDKAAMEKSIRLFPSDLLIIGLLKEGTDETQPCIGDHVEPLIAIECRSQDPWEKVSVLSLYTREEATKELLPWFQLLEQGAEPILG